MIKYVLTSEEARENVNLREYSRIISDAIFEVVDDDEPLVCTFKDYYYVETDIPITKLEQRKIDEILCESRLGKYRVEGEMLFTSIREEDGLEDMN